MFEKSRRLSFDLSHPGDNPNVCMCIQLPYWIIKTVKIQNKSFSIRISAKGK